MSEICEEYDEDSNGCQLYNKELSKNMHCSLYGSCIMLNKLNRDEESEITDMPTKRRGRPRKTENIKPQVTSDLPMEVTNCLHGRSSELIKMIQELKEKIEPIQKEIESLEKELQTIQEFMSKHETTES